jgi:hypothetical protein
MSPIIALPIREAHPDLDAEARSRTDRLNRATAQEMQAALAFLSMIDPEAFEIAFQAVPADRDALDELEDPEPVCGRCGGPVALFANQGMTWHHYQAPLGVPSEPEIIETGHEPRVEWYLPEEIPDDF